MIVKQSVFNLLLNANGQYISGEQIAAFLHVTQAGIWKGIKSPKAELFSISAISNKDYAIIESGNSVTGVGIKQYFLDRLMLSPEKLQLQFRRTK